MIRKTLLSSAGVALVKSLGILMLLFCSTAWAGSISVNQHPAACVDSGTANSKKCSFTSNATVGNFIWVSASAYPGSSSSNPSCTVSDDGGDTFTAAAGNGQHTSGGGWLYIWGARVATAGKGVTVACTPASGSTMYITLDIFELTIGSSTTWTFPDKGNSAAGVGGTSLSVTSFTPSNNNEMVLVAATNDFNAGFTAGSNFTLGSNVTSGQSLGTEYWVQSTATATTAPFTETSSDNWAEVASSVSAAGAGGGQAPSISSLSPTSGAVGSSIVIAGSNFGSTQGTVTFNGTSAAISNWNTGSITATVPTGATTGNVVVTAGGVASNGVSFTVTPAPNISSLSPTSGVIGASVTINGTNFGSTQGSVKFNGTTASISNWATGSIGVTVPSGATTGNVVVTAAGGVASNGASFTVIPTPNITSLTPNSGAVGSSIVIAGSNFGSTQGTVTFNGTSATISNWATGSITATVPTGATTGNVVVTAGGVASNGVNFTVTPAPNISSLSPTSGVIGAAVTITGTNFGSTQGSVKFNGTTASISNWATGSIGVTVPSGATTGNVVATAAGGVASNGVSFTVIPTPSITSLTPNSGAVGSSIVIAGSNFGSTQGTVTFNGTSAAISAWNTGSITATVPTGATTGNVVVTAGGVASNGVSFTVTPAPNISSLSPTSGVIGASVTITGTNFGSTQGSVKFNGTTASIGNWATGSIGVTVPSGATTGNVVVTAAGGVASNGVSFTVIPTPSITSLTPTSGAVGSSIVIAGSNFGSTQGTVTFNGTSAAISAWNTGSITATVPTGATTGNVVVTTGGVASNGVSFTVTPAPNISSLSPTSGAIGASVTINGTNFGSTQGSVTFNGTTASISNWATGSIGVTVPNGATTGNVVVTAAGGVASNGVSFTVKASYSFSVTYAPDGGILTANDSVNGNWTYTYDDFARLSTANNSAPTQGFSYVYDQYGNRWQQNLTAGSGGTSNLTFSNNASAATWGTNNQCYHAAGVTNQPDTYCYDAAGNLLNDGSHSYTYDAENRIISVDGGQTATYTYNAAGHRIRKVSSAGTVDYLHDLAGHQITELNSTGGWNRGEVYSGGRHVATYNNGTTYFIQSDWQGSERARTTLSGAQCETTANLPFGDGQSIVTNCPGDPSPNHFTGKQRDTESNLDYFEARYYSSSMGRFVTPDWDGKPVAVPYAESGDPQSLNLYAYVRNSPISRVDADGHNFAGYNGMNADTTGGDPTESWGFGEESSSQVETVADPPSIPQLPPVDREQMEQDLGHPIMESGKLRIYSSGSDPDDSSLSGSFAGHSWISYTPDGGPTTTYGTWGNNPQGQGNGLMTNLELGRPAEATRTVQLDDEHEAILMKTIQAYKNMGNDAWGLFWPCSSFAAEAWHDATNEILNTGRNSNPTDLRESIKKANGGQANGTLPQVLERPPDGITITTED